MTPVTHHLTEQQIGRLKAESQRTGLSVAEIIRRAIDAWLYEDVRTQDRERA